MEVKMIREAKNAAGYVSLPKKSTIPKKSLWKKLKRFFVDNKWPLIGSIWVVAFSLGYIGFSEYFSATGEIYYFWDIFYRTLQLLALESGFVSGSIGWELQIARFLIPAVAAYTAVQALAIIFKEQIQMFRLRLMKNHVVICGLGEKGLLLSNGFREKDEHVVVIEKDGNNGLLKQCKEQGTIILSGNAADPIQLRRARVNKAKYLISVCGDDGANAEVAVRARELVLSRKGRALSCLIHISDSQLCDLLRERELKLGKLDAFRMELFNVFESGARILLDEYPPFNKTSNDHNSSPHLVIVGMGHIGENLIVNATRKWLDRSKNNSGLLRFSLIDKEAVKKKESLYLRYPKLKKVCDLMPVEADIKTLEFNQTKFIFNEQVQSGVTIVYICMDNDLDALRAGLAIRQQFMALDTPIVISMIQDKGPAILLKGGEDKQDIFNNLHIFGILEHTCTPDLISRCTYEILARAIHADYV